MTNNMDIHVRVLGILHIVFGVMGLIGALVVVLIFGGAASIVGMVGAAEDPDALLAVPIIGIVGTAIVVLVLVLSIPSLVAGIGLLNYRPWARILTLVLCVLGLLNFPIGTAISIYGFWVLLSPETELLFRQQGPRPAPNWNRHVA